MIKIGNQDPIIMIGSVGATKIYIGGEQVYPSVSLTAFWMSQTGVILDDVCSQSINIQRWHDGANAMPENGDKIYTNYIGTTIFNGDRKYYKLGINDIMTVGIDGVVANYSQNYC